MSIEYIAWGSDGSEYGYNPEEWEYLPYEIRELIVAQFTVRSEEIEPEEKPIEETTRVQDVIRRSALKRSLQNVNEANRRLGLQVMTSDHPKYRAIDETYGIEGARKRGERFDKKARYELLLACANCAVADCSLRGDYKSFEAKYHKSTGRKKFLGNLEQDPTTPC